ncbi:MAG TPA: membrane dipeptidase [Methylomirabilota bacterium]|jgi:membrane dipeptidase
MWCGCSERWTPWVAAVPLDRRQALQTLAAALLAAGCASVKPEHNEAALRVAEESTSVDLHSHPGMFPSSPLSTERQLERMTTGKVRASLFAAVADGPVIGRRPSGGLYAAREPRPGELYGYTYRSLGDIRARATAGKLVLIQSPADLDAPRAQGKPGALLAVEGGDFLEGRIERVQEAWDRGVRSIQLTHYRVNELGDIQTDPPVHGGLTPFGLDVIREMNRLGMVVDIAHLTLDGVRKATEVTRKPLLLSHTVLKTNFARSISAEHARLVAKTNGVIGIFPVNSGGYYGFSGYVEHIVRMIKAVGVDHVGIGTDMDGISPPSFVSYTDYSQWPSIPAALLAQGYSREDVGKVIGGNFLRVYRESAA